MTGDNYEYFYVEKEAGETEDMFDKIMVDMLKTVLQYTGTDDVFNRIISTVLYDINGHPL